ncbi:hypothetical protein ABI214_00225 [Prescottella soli]|uniref:Uncharacterized protein n=1 Tax=Prescottella soli TaxID=1543852 RepID=A0ABW9G2G9_9NOCA
MALFVGAGNLDGRGAAAVRECCLVHEPGGVAGAGKDSGRGHDPDAGDLEELGAAGGEFGLDTRGDADISWA